MYTNALVEKIKLKITVYTGVSSKIWNNKQTNKHWTWILTVVYICKTPNFMPPDWLCVNKMLFGKISTAHVQYHRGCQKQLQAWNTWPWFDYWLYNVCGATMTTDGSLLSSTLKCFSLKQ